MPTRALLASLLLLSLSLAGAADAGPGPAGKMRVAVLRFEARGISEEDAEIVTEILRSKIIVSGLFSVVDREHVDAILREIELQESGLAQGGLAIEAGRLLAAEYVVTGSLMRLGPRLEIDARFVNVETGAAKGAARVSIPNYDALYDSLEKLALGLIKSALGYEGFTFDTRTRGQSIELGLVGSVLRFENPYHPEHDGLKWGGGACVGGSTQIGGVSMGFYSLWTAVALRRDEYIHYWGDAPDLFDEAAGKAPTMLPLYGALFFAFGDKVMGPAFQAGIGYGFAAGGYNHVVAPMLGFFYRNWYLRLHPSISIVAAIEELPTQYALQLELGRSLFLGTRGKPATAFRD